MKKKFYNSVEFCCDKVYNETIIKQTKPKQVDQMKGDNHMGERAIENRIKKLKALEEQKKELEAQIIQMHGRKKHPA